MKLTNKQKAKLCSLAPQCANRLADEMWNILDLDQVIDDILFDDRSSLDQEELFELYEQAENYLTRQIGKNL